MAGWSCAQGRASLHTPRGLLLATDHPWMSTTLKIKHAACRPLQLCCTILHLQMHVHGLAAARHARSAREAGTPTCRFAPTAGSSCCTSMPCCSSSSRGPMPESFSRCGECTAPAASTTSPPDRTLAAHETTAQRVRAQGVSQPPVKCRAPGNDASPSLACVHLFEFDTRPTRPGSGWASACINSY
jgi:hypothetical protein